MSYRTLLGDWGEEVAAAGLSTNGFTDIVLLNKTRRNYPGGDLLGTLDDQRYLFSVKARDKFMQNGLINWGYNVYPEKVISAAVLCRAEPAWIAVQVNRRNLTYSAYWGKITEIAPSAAKAHRVYVSMIDSAILKYRLENRCLARDVFDTRVADIFAGKGY
jgi:hypothetical protein